MKANAKKETIYVNIIMLVVFFFAFLGTEYLFDNCMMYVTDASGVVRAQNQMLGVSAIGFLLYNWISGFLADKSPWVTGGTGLFAFGIGAGCMGCIILHAGYVQMMIAGGVLFFLLGLLVFYLSAGFFSVYFTVGFMDISYHSAKPKLWAGLGRAVNNVCALMIMTLAGGFASVRYEVMIVAVILFFLISVLAFSYQNILIGMELRSMEAAASALMPQTGGTAEAENKQTGGAAKPEDKQTDLSTTDKFTAFGEQYSLTEREREVLRALLSSGENVQDIAHTLGISRAAIYRHISNMNEKTATKARMGLIQFYYGWNPEK